MRSFLTLLSICVFGAVACSNDTAAPNLADLSSDEATAPAGVEQTDDGVTFAVDGAVASAEASGTADEVVAMLSDGLLTFDEYESAMLRTFECANQAGVEVVELGVTDDDGYPQVNYAVPVQAEGMTEAETEQAFADCYTTYGLAVDSKWQVGNSENSRPGVLEAKIAALAECLDANGVPTAATEDIQDLPALERAADDLFREEGVNCMEESGLLD